MAKKKEPTYSLTFKGFAYRHFQDTNKLEAFTDDLELFMRRNGYNAIVFDNGVFSFVTVEKE